MKKIQLKDFLEYKFISNLKCSDNGKTIVYCVNTCNEEDNTYDSNLYMLKEGKEISLTNGNAESSYQFIDNDTILFSSVRDKKEKDKIEAGEELSVFYTLSLQGGEAKKAFSVPLNVSSYKQIKKGIYLLSVQYDERYSLNKDSDILKVKKENEDYEEFNQIPFYLNGQGYASFKSARLFLYDVDKNKLEAISDSCLDVADYCLDDSKEKVVFLASKRQPKPSMKEGIYMYTFASKKSEEVLIEKEYSINGVQIFNGNILFMGNKEVTHGNNENGRFYMLDMHSKKITLLYDNQESVWNSVGSDCRYGGGQSSKVINDKYYFVTTIEDKAPIYSVDRDGKCSKECIVEGSVDCFDMYQDTIYFVGMLDGKLQEIYQYKDKKITCLTHYNESIVSNKYIADYQCIHFNNEGIDFKGWVLLPKDYDESKKYPAILDIHGGPKTVYGKVFYHEMQVWANLGYFVFFTNPRGSDGRGNDFMDIFGKYGSIDYDDLMKFSDIVLDTYPSIDSKRVGVTGGSYGGFMTNWIITHTDRFKCAATQRSISNWVSFYGTSDIGFHFAEDQTKGSIFSNPKKLWEQSPLKYINNAHTPTLFIHSDEDYRCPLEQGLQLYTALVDKGVEAKFVMFKKENHELSRNGKPKHRVKRLEEITNWMEKHLK